VVAYRATAKRGEAEYTALFNSTYVRQRRLEAGSPSANTHLTPQRLAQCPPWTFKTGSSLADI
jgi:hypothetical protein